MISIEMWQRETDHRLAQGTQIAAAILRQDSRNITNGEAGRIALIKATDIDP